MGKGGGGQPSQQNVVQTNLPEYARPYFENIMQRAQAESYRPYTPYEGERLAGFNPYQQQTQQQIMGMQTPGQFGAGSNLISSAGFQALQGSNYRPGQFSTQQVNAPALQQYQMENVGDVAAQRVNAPRMRAAQLDAPETFGRAQAKQYMSPYMQQVVNVQKRQALEDAQKTQLAAGLSSARQGTRGGARQLLATTERERALGQQLGDIQARGLQSSYEQAQQQFERDRAAGMQAGLANLNAEQQARVQNQAASLQAQGMNAEQALRAALANQQAGLSVGQQNLAAQLGVQQLGAQQGMQAALANQQQFLEAQRLAEQSRQFGGTLGMQGAQIAAQSGQALGQLGTAQQAADMQRLQAQQQVGGQQQALEQQRLDQQYADFLRQRDYPMEMLGYYSNLLRGIPVGLGSTSMVYGQSPSMASQIGGLGLAGLSLGRLTGAFAEGGEVSSYAVGGSTAKPSLEKIKAFNENLADEELQMRLRSTEPGTPEHLMVAGEIQARKDARIAALAKQGGQPPVIADLLTGGAMPQMPQMPPQMPQQVAMLPENAGGVAALPAPNMEDVEAMAAGGLVAFEGGGPVARYDVGGGVSLTDVLRTLNMDERRFYQQTGRLPPRAQAMLTGQAPMPAAPTPGMGMAGTGPATISMAADPNAPAQVPLPENMSFYPGTAGLIQGPQAVQRGISQGYGAQPTPGSLPADVRRADASEMASIAAPDLVTTPGTKKEAPVDDGGLDTLGKAQGLDMESAFAKAQGFIGDKLAALGDPFKDIRDEMKTASEERKADLKNSAWMRLAEFGFGMAAGTSPYALANIGKAGVEALKGFGDDLREKKKLDRDDRKMLADIKRLENADKRDNIIKTADLGLKIIGEMNADQRARLAANTQLRVADIYSKNREGNKLDPMLKEYLGMSMAQKAALDPATRAMLEQRLKTAVLPSVVESPGSAKIRP